jgi:hypothetical protein
MMMIPPQLLQVLFVFVILVGVVILAGILVLLGVFLNQTTILKEQEEVKRLG